jgi:hypothetical protein
MGGVVDVAGSFPERLQAGLFFIPYKFHYPGGGYFRYDTISRRSLSTPLKITSINVRDVPRFMELGVVTPFSRSCYSDLCNILSCYWNDYF